MKLFDYSELIRVIDNVEIREEKERDMEIVCLKERYKRLENSIVESGILDDWHRLKKLCVKAGVRLCVSHQCENSIGCVLGHTEDFKYCKEYNDNGTFKTTMSSGSGWEDTYGFCYDEFNGIVWKIWHTSDFQLFKGFEDGEEKKKYETRIKLLETFRDTYEDYRSFQLNKIENKFETRIKMEDIIRAED